MSYDPKIHHRRSIRLRGYDYSQAGAYFITLCTHNRECALGDVIDGQMHLNQFGKIVAAEWLKTGEIRENVELDVFEVMPNHMHGILVITHQIAIVGATGPVAPTLKSGSLGAIMAQFESIVTKKIRNAGLRHFKWQRGFYDHIIRNERALRRIQEYIINNPANWEYDQENHNDISAEAKKQFWKKFLAE